MERSVAAPTPLDAGGTVSAPPPKGKKLYLSAVILCGCSPWAMYIGFFGLEGQSCRHSRNTSQYVPLTPTFSPYVFQRAGEQS